MLDEFGAPKMKNGKMPTKGDIKVAKQLAKKAKQDAKKAKKEAKIAKKDAKILARQSKPYHWTQSPTKYSRVSHRLGSSRVSAPLQEDMIMHFAPECTLFKEHHYVEINGHYYCKKDIDKYQELGGSLDTLPNDVKGVNDVLDTLPKDIDKNQQQEMARIFNDADFVIMSSGDEKP